ncbi:MAG: tRNA guanosine(34) transglycosylase Tgt [Elusimicrobiota bacterium]|nr:tRNA guanosine(34) transglycosylase Tgt [Elusimicrobiota bacterium]
MFRIEKKCSKTRARTGKISTQHGEISTPVFMPVGTQGTVKTISNNELIELNTEIFVTNTYHLYLRPGIKVIKDSGGLHKFIGWNRPLLTDSGGYQVYSLADLRKITTDGVEFQSHIDGSQHFFSPESVIEMQKDLGADIVMCFDDCAPYPSSYDYAKESMERTLQWARRSKKAVSSKQSAISEKKNCELSTVNRQLLFGIIQGSTYIDLRKVSAIKTVELNFDGYALGGLSVGEPKEVRLEIIENILPLLPAEKPRYAMGIGTPEEILTCIEFGIDMFDCVLPTRNGRNGQAITTFGKLNIKNSEYKTDYNPLDPECGCPVCQQHSRAYLHHLFHSGELLSMRLLTLHNLFFMLKLLDRIRKSIEEDRFLYLKEKFLKKIR